MSLLDIDGYRLLEPERYQTPILLHFEERVADNLKALLGLVPSPDQLCPHIKTHKSLDRVRQCMAAGIRRFKGATLKEVEVIARAGAEAALLAYPLAAGSKAQRFRRLQQAYPGTRFWTLVARREHLDVLADAEVLVDVDVGMHRTGIDPAQAADLYRAAVESATLTVAGLHAYDGHHHFSDPSERRAAADGVWQQTAALVERIETTGLEVPHVIVGGSFSFPYYPPRDPRVAGSPGTWIYWDAGYGERMPDMPFRPAALVLGQVIDAHPAEGTATLDVGSKAISADKRELAERFRLAGYPDARLIAQSEEHGVVATGSRPLQVGQYVLAIPGHVCTTTPKYPGALRIDAEGRCIGWLEHDARDR